MWLVCLLSLGLYRLGLDWTGLDWIWDLGIEIGLDKNTNLELFRLHIWLKLKQE